MDDTRAGVQQKALVTMRDIAVRCDVCKQTVSRALRGSPKVSPAKTEEILRIAQELGYDLGQQSAARRMSLQKHGLALPHEVVALFCAAHMRPDAYLSEMIWGAWGRCDEQGYGVLLAPIELSLPARLSRGEVDGAILVALGTLEGLTARVQYLRERTAFGQKPIVTLITPLPGCSAVMADDQRGAELAAGHLLDLGHRHMLHFYGEEWTDYVACRRRAGYQRAAAQRGLVFADVFHPGHWYRTPGYSKAVAVALDTLAAHPEITAVLARHDTFAIELLQALQRKGIRVPEELSVIGFDDTGAYLDAHGQNILTTIHLPLNAMGQEAARLLVQRLRGDLTEDCSRVMKGKLVVRATTGPPWV